MRVIEGTTIRINRGDTLPLRLTIPIYETDEDNEFILDEDGNRIIKSYYEFKEGDVVTFGIYNKRGLSDNALVLKTITVDTPTIEVNFTLSSEEMKIGELINKPTDYWYEVQLDDGNMVRTVIGYDTNGTKVLKLYPEGSEVSE